MNRYSLFLVITVMILGGCATHAPLTRDESLALTTRTYSGVVKQQALDEIERLFRLADGNDFRLAHSDTGFRATRGHAAAESWWDVRADPVESGVKLVVINGGWAPAGSIDGNATYSLFWERLDYLLGKLAHWITCAEAQDRARHADYALWGSLAPLCANANDTHPNPAKDDRAKFSVTD